MCEANGYRSSWFSIENPLATESFYVGNASSRGVADTSIAVIKILPSIAES